MVLIASYTLYFLIVAVIFYMITKKDRMMSLSALLSVGLAIVIGKLVGQLHSNQQPFAELPNVNQLVEKAVNNSFPSDHTMIFFAVCFTFFLYKKKGRFLWIILACLVGFSRIWVGVHYPGDILVGALIAMASAYLIFSIVRKNPYLLKKNEDRDQERAI